MAQGREGVGTSRRRHRWSVLRERGVGMGGGQGRQRGGPPVFFVLVGDSVFLAARGRGVWGGLDGTMQLRARPGRTGKQQAAREGRVKAG